MAAVLAVFALGGCAQGAALPTAAADIDGTVVTDADLAADTDAFNAVMAANGVAESTRANVLSMAVRGVIADEIQTAAGVTIGDDEVGANLNALGQALFAVPATKDLVVGTVRLQMLQERMQDDPAGAAAFIDTLLGAEVTINPRYGTWYVDQMAIADETGVLASPLTR
jgi:hypothetical protein